MLQYNVHDIRTTVRDVMMVYSKERYMENLPPSVIDQVFPFRFGLLQSLKNWMVVRPGNEAINFSHI